MYRVINNSRRCSSMTVKYENFLEQLQQQYEYLSRGGSEYRQHTARLALFVANRLRDVTCFMEPQKSLYTVKQVLSSDSEERIKDVAKMLNVLAKETTL